MRNLSREDKVREFHIAFGQPIEEKDSMNLDYLNMRMTLIKEEVDEIDWALADYLRERTTKNRAHLLKELCDLQYVLSGLAVSVDFDLEVPFSRVHASNMSKLGENGRPIYRDDGKVLKPESYSPPNLEDLV